MKSYINFLGRNKLYTAIEAIGLALSLAFVILLGTYIWQQYRVINENPDAGRIFIFGTQHNHGLSEHEKKIFDADPLPGIEIMARYSLEQEYPVMINNEQRLVKAAYADKEWFEIFPYYKILTGTPEIFNDINNVFVSRSFANSLGNENEVIGLTITDVMREQQYVIAGIIDDLKNTLFQNSDILFNARSIWPDDAPIQYYSFGNIYTFARLTENADKEILEATIYKTLKEIAPMAFEEHFKPVLYSIEDVYFSGYGSLNNTNKTMLVVLIINVIALLISAVFNYINLSFALTIKRAKEMATRRLVGATRRDIIIKCVLESIGFTVFCFAAAVLIAIAFEPTLNSLLVGKNPNTFVPISIQIGLGSITVYILSAIILGTIVGILPAISASTFQPIEVIKGSFRAKSKMVFSKIFIIIQSTLAVVLIAMAILMEAQLAHMINVPTNANTKNLFYLNSEFLETPKMAYPLYNALMENPDVKRVGFGDGFPGFINLMKSYIYSAAIMEDNIRPKVIVCDSTYFTMLNPTIVEDYHTPLHGSLWLGESTSRAMQLTDSTEAKMFSLKYADTDHLGGIVKDIPVMPQEIGYSAIEVLKHEDIEYGTSIIIETTSESKDIKESILQTYREFSKECVGVVLMSGMSGFMSEIHQMLLAPTTRIIRLVEIFTLIAVILSLLGLVAMSTYYAEQKSKEIAVRKVFGGTIQTETINNVKSYMFMTLIACFIGTPVAVYIAGRYLEQFAYKISNTWWVFALAIIIAFFFSLVSVLWQTLKAARTNPAKELKKD